MEEIDAKEIFEAYKDKNGWISKEPNEIAEEWTEDAEFRIDLLKELWSYYNLFEKEFNGNKWRFA